MSEPEQQRQLPISDESRVQRIERIIGALPEIEQDELRIKLNLAQLNNYCTRLRNWRNCAAFAIHMMIVCGTLFGLLVGLVSGLGVGLQVGFVAGLLTFLLTWMWAGMIFGSCMAVYFIVLMRVIMPMLAKKMEGQRSALLHVHEMDLPLPAKDAFEICLSSLSATKGTKLEAVDEKNGNIQALYPMSWRSPGELVGIKLDALSDNSTRVRVYSKALFSALEFGKNRINVDKLSRSIEDAGQVHSILKSK